MEKATWAWCWEHQDCLLLGWSVLGVWGCANNPNVTQLQYHPWKRAEWGGRLLSSGSPLHCRHLMGSRVSTEPGANSTDGLCGHRAVPESDRVDGQAWSLLSWSPKLMWVGLLLTAGSPAHPLARSAAAQPAPFQGRCGGRTQMQPRMER